MLHIHKTIYQLSGGTFVAVALCGYEKVRSKKAITMTRYQEDLSNICSFCEREYGFALLGDWMPSFDETKVFYEDV